ncbi:hypothetical protein LP085_08325 [Achromobacter sp. MY14]|uniref:hypothetical protein n=1 Tax=unclassified Achromobacter TaxID=2626865 RepID=UPI001E402F92|nr:hypothetical protein [Achromobacter sp. MY14]MCD0496852.1 hypothetical protein [Achromobacter sp. MY14]
MNARSMIPIRWTRPAAVNLIRPLMAMMWFASLAGSCIAQPSLSATTAAASLIQLRLPEGSTRAMLADRMWLHGHPAQVLVFDAPVDARAVVRVLVDQQPGLSDLNVLPGHLILSGWIDDRQWVAQMQSAGPSRTVGMVSSLRVTAPSNPVVPAWLPEGARLRLDFAVMEAGVKVWERVWQHSLPPSRIAPLLEAALLRDGWHLEADDGALQSWTRADQRMQVSLVPLDAGSGLRIRRWAP